MSDDKSKEEKDYSLTDLITMAREDLRRDHSLFNYALTITGTALVCGINVMFSRPVIYATQGFFLGAGLNLLAMQYIDLAAAETVALEYRLSNGSEISPEVLSREMGLALQDTAPSRKSLSIFTVACGAALGAGYGRFGKRKKDD